MRSPAFIACLVAALAVACSSDGSTPPDDQPGPAASFQIVDGDAQSGVVGAELADALTIRLTDAQGRGLAGRVVTFAVVSGGGSLLLPTATTDAQGRAADRWTLGTSTAEAQTVEARLVDAETGRGFTAAFSATPIAGEAAEIAKVEGDGQLGRPATTLTDWIAVALADRYDNPVAGASVTWTATGGGAPSPATSTSDVLGVARTHWTLGPSEDEAQELAVSVGELPVVTFTAAFLDVSVDFGAGRWESIADLPYPIRAASATTDGSRIFVFGGSDASGRVPSTLIYDPETDTWSQGASMPVAVDFLFASVAEDGIHVLGGTADPGRTAYHFVYHPDTDGWGVGPTLPIGVSGASGETVDGEVVVVGGVTGARDRHAEVQVFDPTAGAWTFGPAHPEPHLNAASELLNGVVYVAGGNVAPLSTSDEAYGLDVASGVWEALPPMPATREALGAGKTRGNFCAFGGRLARDGGFNTPFDDAFCYDFTGGQWRMVAPLPAARAEIASVTLDGWIYAIGGHDASYRAQKGAWRFTGVPVAAAPAADPDLTRPVR